MQRPIPSKRPILYFTAFVAIGMAGCTSTMTDVKLSASHPANPEAAQAAVPPLEPFLMSGTNLVLTKPVPAPPSGHEHGHDHGAKRTGVDQ